MDSMATMEIPAMGYGLRYEYGIFKQTIRDGWQQEQPDNWLRRPDPWEVARPHEKVEVRINSTIEVRAGRLHAIVGRPSTLIGIPYDRPVVGYGGKTINTLRLWAAAAPDYFDFQEFSHGDFVAGGGRDSGGRIRHPRSLSRRLHRQRAGTALRAGVLSRGLFAGGSGAALPPRQYGLELCCPRKPPSSSTIRIRRWRVPELMRILLDDAKLGWDEAWDLTQRTLGYTNHTLLPEALEKWPVAWFETLLPRHLEIIYEINRRLLDSARTRFPGDEGRLQRISLIEEGPGQARAHGQPGDCRLAQHQWRGGDPLPTAAQDNGQGPGRDVSRALQQ